jgi:hypothetical protein
MDRLAHTQFEVCMVCARLSREGIKHGGEIRGGFLEEGVFELSHECVEEIKAEKDPGGHSFTSEAERGKLTRGPTECAN